MLFSVLIVILRWTMCNSFVIPPFLTGFRSHKTTTESSFLRLAEPLDNLVHTAVLPLPPFGKLVFSENVRDGSLGIELDRGMDLFGYGVQRKNKVTINDETLIHEGGGSLKVGGEEIGFQRKLGVRMKSNETIDYVKTVDVHMGKSLMNSLKTMFHQLMSVFKTVLGQQN